MNIPSLLVDVSIFIFASGMVAIFTMAIVKGINNPKKRRSHGEKKYVTLPSNI